MLVYDCDLPDKYPVRVFIEDQSISISIGYFTWINPHNGIISEGTLKFLIQLVMELGKDNLYTGSSEHYSVPLLIVLHSDGKLEFLSNRFNTYEDMLDFLNSQKYDI